MLLSNGKDQSHCTGMQGLGHGSDSLQGPTFSLSGTCYEDTQKTSVRITNFQLSVL
jgi:hypothetical protein